MELPHPPKNRSENAHICALDQYRSSRPLVGFAVSGGRSSALFRVNRRAPRSGHFSVAAPKWRRSGAELLRKAATTHTERDSSLAQAGLLDRGSVAPACTRLGCPPAASASRFPSVRGRPGAARLRAAVARCEALLGVRLRFPLRPAAANAQQVQQRSTLESQRDRPERVGVVLAATADGVSVSVVKRLAAVGADLVERETRAASQYVDQLHAPSSSRAPCQYKDKSAPPGGADFELWWATRPKLWESEKFWADWGWP